MASEKEAKSEDPGTAVINALHSTCMLNSWALVISKGYVIMTATAVFRQTANASHREKQKLCRWFYFSNKLLLFIPV
jgi:hypothetical protein